MAARQRKLTSTDVTEVSGVIHPAHLVEGWIIQKAAAPGLPEGAAILKEHETRRMPLSFWTRSRTAKP
jgi:hypothetical protein